VGAADSLKVRIAEIVASQDKSRANPAGKLPLGKIKFSPMNSYREEEAHAALSNQSFQSSFPSSPSLHTGEVEVELLDQPISPPSHYPFLTSPTQYHEAQPRHSITPSHVNIYSSGADPYDRITHPIKAQQLGAIEHSRSRNKSSFNNDGYDREHES
jgi:hypothetical protein